MTDDRRLLLAVLLCLGIYGGWSWLVVNNRHQQLANRPTATETTAPSSANAPAPAVVPAGERPIAPSVVGAGPLPGIPAPARLPEKLIPLETPELHLVFSTHGGTLAHAVLNNPQYRRRFEDKDIPVDLVRGPGPDGRALQIRFDGASWADDPLADYEAQVDSTGRSVTFRRIAGGATITKRFDVVAPYELKLQVGVTGGTAQGLSIGYGGEQPPAPAPTVGLLSHVVRSYPNVATALCRVDGANKSSGSDKDASLTLPAAGTGVVQFGGLDERFFVSAIAPEGNRQGSCTVSSTHSGEVLAELKLPLPAGGPIERSFGLFLGPKELDLLQHASVLPGLHDDAELGSSIGFGFWTALCVPMLRVMQLFDRWLPNWGVAILLLTVLMKLLLWPLTHAQFRSMEKMKALQPKMADLKKKHGEDKERLNLEMMKLYSEHKVNPLGGCLPMLLQLPIWWALYRLLQTSVLLYRQPFIAGWINDLTAPDPFLVLPITMGVTMIGTQMLQPQMADGAQQKMMMWMMPLMMMFFFLNLPAGLNLYIVASNLLSIAQQAWVRSRNAAPPDESGGALARAGA
jgi:YidC/Oxa1 family membrane protein insertase